MRKQFWRWGLLVASFAAAGLWLSGVDRLSLAERSTRIASVDGWGLDRPDLDIPPRFYDLMSGGAQYQWIGNRQILFFPDLQPIQAKTQGGQVSRSWPSSVGVPTLYDADSQAERPLNELAALFRKTDGRAKTVAVSPDGSRVIWEGEGSHLTVAPLDGSRHWTIDDERTLSGARWTADRKQFYTCEWSVDNRNRSVVAVNLRDPADGAFERQLQFFQPPNHELLGDCVLMPDGALATNTVHLPHPVLTLYAVPPTPKSGALTTTPRLPVGSELQALVYSPWGDRLAWIIERTVPSPLANLHRWLPFLKAEPQRSASLWISGAKGENLHEIGHIVARPGGRQTYLIDYVRWQPDGKTLSYVSDNSLYTIPAR